jgi:heterodisulfide reductase subunit C
MNKFGFVINSHKYTDMDLSDRSLFNRFEEVVPDIKTCMACGSCTASCTASAFTEISLRRIILYLDRGEIKQARKMASDCMLCGKCLIVCPRGINTRNILKEIINLKD